MSKLLFSFFILFGVNAFAATPLITKINQSGFTPEDYRYKETCELYRTRVVVTTEMGVEGSDKPVVMRRIFPIYTSTNILTMIRQAAAEDLQESDVQVCDASTTKVTAQAPGVKSFILFRSSSCAEKRAERVGGSSYQLRSMIDDFCPETNDVGGNEEASN